MKQIKNMISDIIVLMLKVEDLIILALEGSEKYSDEYQIAFDYCEQGIAKTIGKKKGHVNRSLRKLEKKGLVELKVLHVDNKDRVQLCGVLLPDGFTALNKIKDALRDEEFLFNYDDDEPQPRTVADIQDLLKTKEGQEYSTLEILKGLKVKEQKVVFHLKKDDVRKEDLLIFDIAEEELQDKINESIKQTVLSLQSKFLDIDVRIDEEVPEEFLPILMELVLPLIKLGRELETKAVRGSGRYEWFSTQFLPATINLINKDLIKEDGIGLFKPNKRYDKVENDFFTRYPKLKNEIIKDFNKSFDVQFE